MKEIQRGDLSAEEQKAKELAWLKENLTAFWSTAYGGYCDAGRGAIVINITPQGLGEDTLFHYSLQNIIEEQADETSLQLAGLVAEYDPETQFVAVFVRVDADSIEFSMFQIGAGEALLAAMKAHNVSTDAITQSSSAHLKQQFQIYLN